MSSLFYFLLPRLLHTFFYIASTNKSHCFREPAVDDTNEEAFRCCPPIIAAAPPCLEAAAAPLTPPEDEPMPFGASALSSSFTLVGTSCRSCTWRGGGGRRAGRSKCTWGEGGSEGGSTTRLERGRIREGGQVSSSGHLHTYRGGSHHECLTLSCECRPACWPIAPSRCCRALLSDMSAEATCMLSMSSERPVSDLKAGRVEKMVSTIEDAAHACQNNKADPISQPTLFHSDDLILPTGPVQGNESLAIYGQCRIPVMWKLMPVPLRQ